MAKTRSYSELMLEVRETANIDGMIDKWTDLKVYRRIDSAYSAFRELLSDHGHPYYVSLVELTTAVASSPTSLEFDLTLPTDCLRVYYIDLILNGRFHELERFEPAERNNYDRRRLGCPQAFRVGYAESEGTGDDGAISRDVRLLPRPDQAYTVQVCYLPYHATLATAPEQSPVTENVDGFQGWERWIICKAALIILASEGDTEQYVLIERELKSITDTIIEKRSKRDRTGPKKIRSPRGRRRR